MNKIFFWTLLIGTLIFETNVTIGSAPQSDEGLVALPTRGGGGGRGGMGGPRGGVQGRSFDGRMGPRSNVGPRGGYYSDRFNRGYPYRNSPYFWNYASPYYYDTPFYEPYVSPPPPPPPPMYPPMYQMPSQTIIVPQAKERPEPSLPTYTPSRKPDIIVYPPSPSGSTAMPKETAPARGLEDVERTILMKVTLGTSTFPLEVAVDDIYARKVIKLDRGNEGIYYIVPCNEGNIPSERPTENGHWKWNPAAPDQFCGYWVWELENHQTPTTSQPQALLPQGVSIAVTEEQGFLTVLVNDVDGTTTKSSVSSEDLPSIVTLPLKSGEYIEIEVVAQDVPRPDPPKASSNGHWTWMAPTSSSKGYWLWVQATKIMLN